MNFPGVYTGFTTWLATRVPLTGIGDHHPEAIEWPLVFLTSGVVLTALVIGWLIYGKDADTQLERDRFRIPVLWPLWEHLYFIDDIYMNGIVRPIMGPIARIVLWIDMRVIDGIANAIGAVSLVFARVVKVTDENVVDGVFNATGAATGASGSLLRKTFTGRVQQYAAFSFIGVLVIVGLFIIF
jgi:NADH:ubiquinone oxidoreductase subunit 5 (subunit L)/multisubunit Na+/H+ antiporter MnhA subunit